METAIIKQEILLMITPFYQKILCEKSPEDLHHQPDVEQLEEACCDGLLDKLLDSIIEKTASGKRLRLWHMQQGKSFIEIELCNSRQVIDRHLSIDPYSFLPIMLQN